MTKIKRTEEEKRELRLQQALNRRPSRWSNLTVPQFEYDIQLLQETVKEAQQKEAERKRNLTTQAKMIQQLIVAYEDEFLFYQGEDKELLRIYFLELITLTTKYVLEPEETVKITLRKMVRMYEKVLKEKLLANHEDVFHFLLAI